MPRTGTCHQMRLGPHVGVRKAGLVSTSACAPLGAFYFTGSSARETRTTAVDDSDTCPLGAAVVLALAITGYLRRLCTPVITYSEIHHWCAVGQELIVILTPLQFCRYATRQFLFVVCSSCVVHSFRETSYRPSANAIFLMQIECTRRGGVIGVRGFRTNLLVDVGSS